MIEKKMLNEAEWAKRTASRLKRSGLTRERWDVVIARCLKDKTTGAFHQFAMRYKIPVSMNPDVPYGTRVKLAVYTIHLAIKAKDEAEFRAFIDQEVKQAAESLGLEL
jgi:hypothetical protein